MQHEERGWTIEEWTDGAKIAVPTYYTLPEDCKPLSVKIGRRRIIRESPREWLDRMAQRGGVPVRTAAQPA